jgi:hypothetical protein
MIGHNLHVARRLFDILTDCEIAHQMTGISHHAYLTRRAAREIGMTRRVLRQILNLGHEGIPAWMEVFLAEFEDCLE